MPLIDENFPGFAVGSSPRRANGTSQDRFLLNTDDGLNLSAVAVGTTAFSAWGEYAHQLTLPANAAGRWVRALNGSNAVEFVPIINGSDNTDASYRVWTLRPVRGRLPTAGSEQGEELIGRPEFAVTVKAGTALVKASSVVFAAQYRFADQVVGTLDDYSLSPGVRVVGAAGDGALGLVFDPRGATHILVEGRLPASSPATSCGFTLGEI